MSSIKIRRLHIERQPEKYIYKHTEREYIHTASMASCVCVCVCAQGGSGTYNCTPVVLLKGFVGVSGFFVKITAVIWGRIWIRLNNVSISMNQYLYRCTLTWSGPRPVINSLLWAIVFILTSGVLPEEQVWMAKWDHSKPLNRTWCCFYTLLCLISEAFLATFGCTVGVSKTHSSPHGPLIALWMSLT